MEFGEVALGGRTRRHGAQLTGPAVVRTCPARATDDRIRAVVDDGRVDVWIDPVETGRIEGEVILANPVGEARVAVSALVLPPGGHQELPTPPAVAPSPAVATAPEAESPTVDPPPAVASAPEAEPPADEPDQPWVLIPPRRSDPPADFPVDRFFAYLSAHRAGAAIITVAVLFIVAIIIATTMSALSEGPPSRASDSTPLSVSEVFPNLTIIASSGVAYAVDESDENVNCSMVGNEVLDGRLAQAGCSQFVRANVTSMDRKYIAPVGVVNLSDRSEAKSAAPTKAGIAFVGFSNTASTARALTGTAQYWRDYGHYLIYCLVARNDAGTATTGDPAVEAMQKDLLSGYLTDKVLAKRK
ncbi:hypothetical protein ACWKSP_35040 [Micromonosporaceae bacterium Da 78-11]